MLHSDWTIHSSSPSAHPSFRLITTLRLFRLLTPESEDRGVAVSDDELQKWRGTLLGTRESISPENECKWRTTLLDLCLDFVDEAQKGLLQFSDQPGKVKTDIEGRIEMLWIEELCVAQAVAESVRRGTQF